MVTLHTEAVAFSPVSSSASSSDSPILTKAMPSSSDSSPEIRPRMESLTTGSSRILSKQAWEELKPTIRHLYLDQNRTLKQLAEYIQEHHEIKPTKKQLTHRISGWGFEKNVKRHERRAIIHNLSPEMKTSNFETRAIRGRTLDNAKLERWMKLEGRLFEAAKDEQDGPSGTPETCSETPFLDLTTGELQGEQPSNQDHLSFCYKIGGVGCEAPEGSDEPAAKLRSQVPQDDCNGWLLESPRLAHNSQVIRPSWTFRLNLPASELCPFPFRTRTAGAPRQKYMFSTTCSPWTESECRTQFRKLESMEAEGVTRLLASMAKIAFQYDVIPQHRLAEKWYRCMVTAAKRTPGPGPCWILGACLSVIDSMFDQGKYAEARDLHQDLHIKVQQILGPHHGLTLSSKFIHMNLLRWFGKQEEEDAINRELLQSQLTFLGPRHNNSIHTIHNLGLLCQREQRFSESEHLLMIAIKLRTEHTVIHYEPYTDTTAFNERQLFLHILILARTLSMSGKYTQSRGLLKEGKNRFQKILQRKDRMFFMHQNEMARTQRLAGHLGESETILRDLLRHHENSMTPNRRTSILRELGEILTETHRLGEATSWFEKEFAVLLDNVGLENPLTKSSCKRVGFSYVEMGRYDEATEHFERMIERLSSEDPRGIETRQEFIWEIRGGMNEVNEMQYAALGTPYTDAEEDTTIEDTPTKDS